jgi:hypothetical protein
MFKTFYKGCRAVFNVIYILAKDGTRTLTVSNINAIVGGASGVIFYLNKGGKYEYALDAVVDVAREQSCLGGGEFELLYEDEAEVGTRYTCRDVPMIWTLDLSGVWLASILNSSGDPTTMIILMKVKTTIWMSMV